MRNRSRSRSESKSESRTVDGRHVATAGFLAGSHPDLAWSNFGWPFGHISGHGRPSCAKIAPNEAPRRDASLGGRSRTPSGAPDASEWGSSLKAWMAEPADPPRGAGPVDPEPASPPELSQIVLSAAPRATEGRRFPKILADGRDGPPHPTSSASARCFVPWPIHLGAEVWMPSLRRTTLCRR